MHGTSKMQIYQSDQLIALTETKSRDCEIEIKYCDTLRRPRKLSKK